jgi:hypothetical protein
LWRVFDWYCVPLQQCIDEEINRISRMLNRPLKILVGRKAEKFLVLNEHCYEFFAFLLFSHKSSFWVWPFLQIVRRSS